MKTKSKLILYSRITYFYLLLLIFVISSLTGCTFNKNIDTIKEKAFVALYPGIQFNDYITLQEFDSFRTKYERYSSDILVKNVADIEILLLMQTGIHIWVYNENDQQWKKVNDRGVWINLSDKILYPGKNNRHDLDSFWIVPINPNIGDIEEPTTIRVVFLGEVLSNNQQSGKKVGGYLDITYQPVPSSMFEP